MPNTFADYTMGVVALVVLAYVAITATAAVNKRRNHKEPAKEPTKEPEKPAGPDLVQVVENNTEAMRDLTGVVGGLRDFMLQNATRTEVKIDEVLAHVRARGGGGE